MMAEETYTEAELKDMSRVALRQTAVRILQIANKDAAAQRSDDLIQQILDSQSNGSKKGGKAAAKGRGRGKAAAEPEETTEPEEAAAEEEAPRSRGRGSSNGVDSAKVDALGKTLDDLDAKLEQVLANQAEIERKLFINLGLTTDLYRFLGEPDDLDARQVELNAEWESNESEGND